MSIFVLCQAYGEANGLAQARIARELMLQMRFRWCNPPLRKTQGVGNVRLRGLIADQMGRRFAISCGKRVPLRDWHDRRA